MDEGLVYIYALCDPRSHEVRYIGAAVNPHLRWYGHMAERHHEVSDKARWLRELERAGVKPELIVFDQVPESEKLPRELEWINRFRSMGQVLTNRSDEYRHGRLRGMLTLEKAAAQLGMSTEEVLDAEQAGSLKCYRRKKYPAPYVSAIEIERYLLAGQRSAVVHEGLRRELRRLKQRKEPNG